MSRTVTLDDHQRAIVTGFRPGGGVATPYVHVGILDTSDNLTDAFTLGVRSAHELSEVVRQEAEFAGTAREEEVTA